MLYKGINVHFEKNYCLLVVGLGLIGGSFARGIRKHKVFNKIIGYDVDVKTCKQAQRLGVIDSYYLDVVSATKEADIILLAIPVLEIEIFFKKVSLLDLQDKIITDVGSSKRNVVDSAERYLKSNKKNFIAGHPIAGSEKSGVCSSSESLFVSQKVILTPSADTSLKALNFVKSLWEALSAKVEIMDIDKHDMILSSTSHLPHLLAFCLVESLSKRNESVEIFNYAAGGFRDFTRIAASDPKMWSDICISNNKELLVAVDLFRKDLDFLYRLLEEKNKNSLFEIFNCAKNAREILNKRDVK